jgi:hypothetical protein
LAGRATSTSRGEFPGQDAGGDDRVPGAVAARPGRVAGVAISATRPFDQVSHVDLAGGVEAKIARGLHLGHQPRHLPAEAGEVLRDDLPRPGGVVWVVTQARRGEVQLGDRAVRAARGEQAGSPARGALQPAGPV